MITPHEGKRVTTPCVAPLGLKESHGRPFGGSGVSRTSVSVWVNIETVIQASDMGERSESSGESSPYVPPAWTEKANCIGVPDTWFYGDPDKKPALTRAEASWIRDVYCHPCPVRLQCLTGALLRNEPCGIWGGMTKRERNRLRRLIKSGEETLESVLKKVAAGESLGAEGEDDDE